MRVAYEHLEKRCPKQEFHIIRTGGVETRKDVVESLEAGASLVQWLTGYMEAYRKHGDDVYVRTLEANGE